MFKKFFLLLIITLSFIPLLLMAEVFDSTGKDKVGIDEHLSRIIPGELMFTNEQGKQVAFKDIIDKPTILTLVYFDCPGLCSPLLDGVSKVIDQLDMTLGKEYQVVTISFNFKDTPEKAAEKKENFLGRHSKEHANDWKYFTGDSLTLLKLVDVVGFRYQQTGNDFIHAGVITILSPEGKITRYLYGTSFLPFDVKMALIEAQKGQARPTINRVLEYCFSYDPEGRKYTLQVTKITATIIIFFAVILFLILIIRSKRKKNQTKDQNV